jgi:hypothetical protein
MISDARALEVPRRGVEPAVVHAAASRMDSPSRSTIWKMLFQMPKIAGLAASGGWRCAGCGVRMVGTQRGVATVCVFCVQWTQWRREGDEHWGRALSDQEHGGRLTAHPELVGLAART